MATEVKLASLGSDSFFLKVTYITHDIKITLSTDSYHNTATPIKPMHMARYLVS